VAFTACVGLGVLLARRLLAGTGRTSTLVATELIVRESTARPPA